MELLFIWDWLLAREHHNQKWTAVWQFNGRKGVMEVVFYSVPENTIPMPPMVCI